MRGDRPLTGALENIKNLFTPHARGSTIHVSLSIISASVYPACAGIDLSY